MGNSKSQFPKKLHQRPKHCCKRQCFEHQGRKFYEQLQLSLQEWDAAYLVGLIMEFTSVQMTKMESNNLNVFCHQLPLSYYTNDKPPCSHWIENTLMVRGLKIALFGTSATDKYDLVDAFIGCPHRKTHHLYNCHNVVNIVNSVIVNYHIYGPLTSHFPDDQSANERKWLRTANVFLLLFEANESSFDYALSCYEDIVKTKEAQNDKNWAVILVGTKCNTKRNAAIDKLVMSMAAQYDIAYIETNAEHGVNSLNVQLLFQLTVYEYWAQSSIH